MIEVPIYAEMGRQEMPVSENGFGIPQLVGRSTDVIGNKLINRGITMDAAVLILP